MVLLYFAQRLLTFPGMLTNPPGRKIMITKMMSP
jgi:hypothetical protein